MLKQFHETKLALGGDTTIVIVMDDNRSPQTIFAKLWRHVFEFERQFSRFLPDSELSTFNRKAGTTQYVTPEFRQLLLASKKMSELTEGLYNPFILPALQKSGYKQSAVPGYEKDPVDDHSHKQVVTIDRLRIKDSQASIPYGTAIDMGGCGKGYLADQLADMLEKEKVEGYWVSLSGDMVLGGHDINGRPWTTTIQSADPKVEELPVIIEGKGRRWAIATSGTFRRDKQADKKDWHHIIDPRTLQPALTDIKLATVIDESCLHADVLASCAVIVGSQKATQFLRSQKVLGSVIQAAKAKDKIELIKFGSVLKSAKEPVNA